eukprot:4076420-Prymnesium_polylepis.2
MPSTRCRRPRCAPCRACARPSLLRAPPYCAPFPIALPYCAHAPSSAPCRPTCARERERRKAAHALAAQPRDGVQIVRAERDAIEWGPQLLTADEDGTKRKVDALKDADRRDRYRRRAVYLGVSQSGCYLATGTD